MSELNHTESSIDQTKAEIIPGIWIGDITAANDINFIKDKNIELVINLSGNTVDKHLTTSYMEIKMDDCDYLYWLLVTKGNQSRHTEVVNEMNSMEPKLLKLFESASDAIAEFRRKRKNVLVNCFAGINRSATTLASYFIRHCGIHPNDAISVIVGTNKKKRNMPALTNYYFRQLLIKIAPVVRTAPAKNNKEVIRAAKRLIGQESAKRLIGQESANDESHTSLTSSQ